MSDKSTEDRLIQRMDHLIDATKENTNVLKDTHTRKAASFNLPWFGIGIGVIGAIQVAAHIYANMQSKTAFGSDDADVAATAAISWGVAQIAIMPFGYFIGGLLVAWRSPGRTILEPALAAMIVAIGSAVYSTQGSGAESSAAICAGIIYFMVGLFGAMIGEKVQHAAG